MPSVPITSDIFGKLGTSAGDRTASPTPDPSSVSRYHTHSISCTNDISYSSNYI